MLAAFGVGSRRPLTLHLVSALRPFVASHASHWRDPNPNDADRFSRSERVNGPAPHGRGPPSTRSPVANRWPYQAEIGIPTDAVSAGVDTKVAVSIGLIARHPDATWR